MCESGVVAAWFCEWRKLFICFLQRFSHTGCVCGHANLDRRLVIGILSVLPILTNVRLLRQRLTVIWEKRRTIYVSRFAAKGLYQSTTLSIFFPRPRSQVRHGPVRANGDHERNGLDGCSPCPLRSCDSATKGPELSLRKALACYGSTPNSALREPQ